MSDLSSVHIPILRDQIVEYLIEPFSKLPVDAPTKWIVDCTLGGGGHTRAFLDALQALPQGQKYKVLAVDQDIEAIRRAQQTFAQEISQGRLELLHSRFGQIQDWIREHPVLGLMADLGFSSDQIEDANRGLSFSQNGPLDMRLDQSQGMTCRQYLLQASEQELANIIHEFGEERFSRRIASAIVKKRRESGLADSTLELGQLIAQAIPPPARRSGKIHPATRTFQALRIAINGELDELQLLLGPVLSSIEIGGRAAILSFHSLEDRMVKQAFKGRDSAFEQLTKKPIEADEQEVKLNPRSRSAKLRVAERIK